MTLNATKKEVTLSIKPLRRGGCFKCRLEGSGIRARRYVFYVFVPFYGPLVRTIQRYHGTKRVGEDFGRVMTIHAWEEPGSPIRVMKMKSTDAVGSATLKDDFKPVAKAIHDYRLTDKELVALTRGFFPNKQGLKARKYVPDLESPLTRVNVETIEYFGELIKKILKRVGYTVNLRIPDPLEHRHEFNIERMTVKDLINLFSECCLFSFQEGLPEEDEVLRREKNRLNRHDLTFEEKRRALLQAGTYKKGHYVVRDYGDHAIGFSSGLFRDSMDQAKAFLREMEGAPSLFKEINQKLETAIQWVQIHQVVHELTYIILGEVYSQRRFKQIAIAKRRIACDYLGLKRGDKDVYRKIREGLQALKWLGYMVIHYTDWMTGKRSAFKEVRGSFVYRIEESQKDFILDVNDRFVGCVSYLWGEKLVGKRERDEIFSRGYFNGPGRNPRQGDNGYAKPAYFLYDFLMHFSRDGTSSVNGVRTIKCTGEHYCREAHITHSRASRRWRVLLDTIRSLDIVQSISPTIQELESLKPSKGLRTEVTFHILDPLKRMNIELGEVLRYQREEEVYR